MPRDETSALIDSLDDLLVLERGLIRGGEFDRLTRIAAEKDRLVAALSDPGRRPDPEALTELRRKAEVNQRLLAAAIQGVRSARQRLTAIRSAQAGLMTYDRNGRASQITPQGGTLEQRR